MRLSHFQGGEETGKARRLSPSQPKETSKMSKSKQIPVTDVADIPAGFVPMASYGAQNPSRKIKSSRAYVILATAWKKKELGGIKLVRTVNDNRGNIYVNKIEADEMIASRTAAPKKITDIFFEGVQPCKNLTVKNLLTELQATNEKTNDLIEQLVSAIKAEQHDNNLTLFN